MGNYTIFLMFENLRRGRQARNFRENDPKILGLKSSSEQIIFRTLSLGAPDGSVKNEHQCTSQSRNVITLKNDDSSESRNLSTAKYFYSKFAKLKSRENK